MAMHVNKKALTTRERERDGAFFENNSEIFLQLSFEEEIKHLL